MTHCEPETEYQLLLQVSYPPGRWLDLGIYLNGKGYSRESDAFRQFDVEVERGETVRLIRRTTILIAEHTPPKREAAGSNPAGRKNG